MRRLAAATRRSSLHLSSDASRDAQHVAHGCILQRFRQTVPVPRLTESFSSLPRPGQANTRCCMQPPCRHFLFLSSLKSPSKSSGPSHCCCVLRAAAASIVHSSTWPIVQAVVAVVSCRVLQLFRPSVRVLAFARPLVRPSARPPVRQSASPAHCFDSYCQIYIKFITTHVVSTRECCILLHLIEELKM